MKNHLNDKSAIDSHLGCFGNFDVESDICQKLCAINIRCSIEQDQNVRMELLEDLADTDRLILKVQ